MRFSVSKLAPLLVAIALAAGCAPAPQVPTAPKIRLAVLDFVPPEGSAAIADDSLTKREGWWLGSRDVYRNAHVGAQVADNIASRLGRTETVTAYLRDDYRHYMADKADALKKAYPDLTDEKLAALLEETQTSNALEIGRELNVDRVVTGRVLEARMSHNRTFHTWRGRVVAELSLWDVARGEKIHQITLTKSMMFSSLQLAMEELANDYADLLARRYGHR